MTITRNQLVSPPAGGANIVLAIDQCTGPVGLRVKVKHDSARETRAVPAANDVNSAHAAFDRQFFVQGQIHDARSPWIGVDLDGTLAADTGGVLWDEHGEPKIGGPVTGMLNRVKKWTAHGRTVKIFTARASSPAQVSAIRKWLAKWGLPDLEVTNVKDFNMVELWDDRCIQVVRDSGNPALTATRRKPGVSASLASLFDSRHGRTGLLTKLGRAFL